MRGLSKGPVLVGVSLLAIMALAVAVGCSETEEAASGTPEAEPMSEQTEAKGATEAEEGTDAVTATLTTIPEGKTGSDEKKQTEVAYLAPGRKVATLETTKGDIKIELWEDKAPNTVVNFVHLANSGRYDGVDFHRVIPGFMAQTGDVEKKGGYGVPATRFPRSSTTTPSTCVESCRWPGPGIPIPPAASSSSCSARARTSMVSTRHSAR